MTTSKIAVPFREGSTIHQMYNDLKDQKVHKYSSFRNKYLKQGVKNPRFMLFRLCRLLRTYTPLQINNSKKTDTVQLVHRDKAAAAREAVKKMVDAKGVHPEPMPTSVKKSVKAVSKKKTATKKKPATKKAASKPVSKKVVVKDKPIAKPVTVAVGVDDDDIIEE